MRPLGFNDQRSPLSRGPSGLPRSGKSGKNSSSTSVETTDHLSVSALSAHGTQAGLELSQREITAGSNPIDARSLRISLS